MAAIVWLEGLIGSGKTTLAQALSRELGYRDILEPVCDNGYLPLFYADPKRWAFPFQMEMLYRRWELHQLATFEVMTGRGAVLDRGMPGDMVFAEMHRDSGNIHELEWQTYLRMYRGLMTRVTMIPRVLVYLDVRPDVALSRIRRRSRDSESGMGLDYLIRLRDTYLSLLERIESGKHEWAAGIKVKRVDWNYDGIVVEPVVRDVLASLSSSVV